MCMYICMPYAELHTRSVASLERGVRPSVTTSAQNAKMPGWAKGVETRVSHRIASHLVSAKLTMTWNWFIGAECASMRMGNRVKRQNAKQMVGHDILLSGVASCVLVLYYTYSNCCCRVQRTPHIQYGIRVLDLGFTFGFNYSQPPFVAWIANRERVVDLV